MKNLKQGIGFLAVLFVLFTAGCSRQETGAPSVTDESGFERVKNRGVAVHDPSLVKSQDGVYYLFGTHMAAASSDDLVHWKMFARDVSGRNPLFNNLFTDRKAFEYVGRNSENWYSVWAPQVIYNKKTQQYMMYFCTTSSYIKSSLCFAVSDTIEGPYSYVDRIIDSGFTPSTIRYTNVSDIIPDDDYSRYFLLRGYNNQHWPNALDPALFYDEDDRLWMTYGSWSGGIFLLEIDEETGYPIHPDAGEDVDPYFGRRLIGGFHHSVEGPWIHYDDVSGYYYLFVTYGSLQRDGGYQIRLFRSENVEGPYADPAGQTLGFEEDHHNYGLKMTSNYNLPSLETAYMAPGHSSVYQDGDRLLTAFHTRFNEGSEKHEPRVHELLRLSDGWLTMAPYRYSGTPAQLGGVSRKELRGEYVLVDHGTEISSRVNTPVEVKIAFGGRIRSSDKSLKGKWSLDENTGEIEMILGGRSFRGVVLKQEDELGRSVLCLSAVSLSNQTVWAVRTE